MMTQSKSTNILLAIIIALIVIGAGYLFWQQSHPQEAQVACTMEAKLCPDGSYVGRSGPKCEFAPCPASNATSTTPSGNDGWQTTTTPSGISFQYPNDLLTTYIHTVDWPPQVQVVNQAFTCTEAGSEIMPAGKTTKVMIGTQTYCVTKESEGAAGSTYIQYAYAFPKADKTLIFTFTLREVQCANYDEPQKTACDQERASFNIDTIVDQMAQSLVVAQ